MSIFFCWCAVYALSTNILPAEVSRYRAEIKQPSQPKASRNRSKIAVKGIGLQDFLSSTDLQQSKEECKRLSQKYTWLIKDLFVNDQSATTYFRNRQRMLDTIQVHIYSIETVDWNKFHYSLSVNKIYASLNQDQVHWASTVVLTGLQNVQERVLWRVLNEPRSRYRASVLFFKFLNSSPIPYWGPSQLFKTRELQFCIYS